MWDTLAAFPAQTLWLFLGGVLLLNLTPGSDVLFTTASGVQGGPRVGMAAGAGVGAGCIIHTLTTAFGLGALVAAHPATLDMIRWFGAAYLAYLAWKSWTEGRADAGAVRAAPTARTAFRRGFITNVTNPKVMLFMLAYLPPFTNPSYGPFWQQILILGTIVVVMGTIITMMYGATAGWMGMRLAKRLGVLNRVAAVIFGGLAAKLALD